jgi:hypothetical protein
MLQNVILLLFITASPMEDVPACSAAYWEPPVRVWLAAGRLVFGWLALVDWQHLYRLEFC